MIEFDFEKEIVDDKMYSVDIIVYTKMNKLETKSPLRHHRVETISAISNKKEIIPKNILYSKYMSNSKIKKYSIKNVKLFTELVNVSATKTCNDVMTFNGYELKEMITKTILNHLKHTMNPDYVICFMVKTNKFFSEGFCEFMLIIKKDIYLDTKLEYLPIKDKFDGAGIRIPSKYADFKRTTIWLHSMLKFNEEDDTQNPAKVINMMVY